MRTRTGEICVVWSVVLGLALILLMSLESAQAVSSNATTLFASSTGSGTACAQATPCALQTALDNATNGTTIYVATGTYTGTGGAVITLTKSITLYGGWDGSSSGGVVRDPDTYPTTLNGESSRRVLFISGTVTPRVEGFIITGGNATGLKGYGSTDAGGGILIENASPIIVNNVITCNVASTSGSTGYGGGILISGLDASPIISGNLIANNTASSTSQGKGGGIFIGKNRHATVIDNTLEGNVAGPIGNSQGGGIYTYSASPLIRGNRFLGNEATPSGKGFGGGFGAQFGSPTLDSNILSDNVAAYGTIELEQNPAVTLTNNIIAQNPAGGVYVRGNALYPFAGVLVHNTIAQNSKEGVYVGFFASGYATLVMTNNIIVSHTKGIYAYPVTDPGADPNVVTATHTLFYGNAQDTAGATITSTNEITGTDPLFLNVAGRDYHVRHDSPAIDAGTAVPWLTTDMDGDIRPWPTGGSYDIGADEAHWRQNFLPLVLKQSG